MSIRSTPARDENVPPRPSMARMAGSTCSAESPVAGTATATARASFWKPSSSTKSAWLALASEARQFSVGSVRKSQNSRIVSGDWRFSRSHW